MHLSEVTKSILATSSLINTTNDSSTTPPTSLSRHVDRSHNIVISGVEGTACFSVRDGFLNRQVLVSSRGIANDNVDMSRPVASPRNG